MTDSSIVDWATQLADATANFHYDYILSTGSTGVSGATGDSCSHTFYYDFNVWYSASSGGSFSVGYQPNEYDWTTGECSAVDFNSDFYGVESDTATAFDTMDMNMDDMSDYCSYTLIFDGYSDGDQWQLLSNNAVANAVSAVLFTLALNAL